MKLAGWVFDYNSTLKYRIYFLILKSESMNMNPDKFILM